MKENQNKRTKLKLISVLCGFLVWLVVVNVADPILTDTVEVSVEIVNGDILEANGLTYEIVGKKTATVSYEVHSSNAYRIRPSDFRAYVDLSELWSVTGSVPVKVEAINNSGYLVSNPVSKTDSIKIETEALQKKRFELKTTLTGEPAEGYKEGRISLSPNVVHVEGPQSMVGQISSVGVEIQLDGLSADIYGTVAPKFYDANGNQIDLGSRVKNFNETVNYGVQILRTKEIPLDFEVSGEAAEGYRFTGVECDVKNVHLVGLKSALASLNALTIPEDILSVEGAEANVVQKVNLSALLPSGVSILEGMDQEVTVTMTVEELESRSYMVDPDKLVLTGERDGYVYTIEQEASLNMRVRALKEDLDSLSINGLTFEADVSELEEGSHLAEVTLREELDAAYNLLFITSCRVRVTSEGEESADAETEKETE